MKLAFRYYHAGDDFWDRAIVLATGNPIHSEMLLDDGRAFSAEAPRGVRFLHSIPDIDDPLVWEVIDLPWSQTPEALAWAESITGAPYDYVGAMSSATPMAVHVAGHYYCSNTSCEFLSRCGVVVPELLNPYALSIWVHRAFNLPIHDCRQPPHHGLDKPAFSSSLEEAAVRGWLTQIQERSDLEQLNREIARWMQSNKDVHPLTQGVT